ncbi:MAG TPA: cytochrome-c peroxidase [Pseudohongiella sp.]|nr:cytochrome-c peroxidase [Pseudohongiella sp.]HBX37544.1 cytochrome-c peroxidase [Pseudohongiella sp.]|tara:strand:- start:3270 stop:4547 length:1278 start_codon:yes stop_codon:yes gene_type:complete
MPRKLKLLGVVIFLLFGYLAWQWIPMPLPAQWSTEQRALIDSLALSQLPPLPVDTGNAVADDPRAAHFGHQLFFDTRLSSNGDVSCATCHMPTSGFTDGRPVAVGIGTTERNTMPLAGAAYSRWYFWDGRKDSLWSQALAPLEDPREHGMTRMEVARLIGSTADYRDSYEQLFGELPTLEDSSRFPPQASPLGDEQSKLAWQRMDESDQYEVSLIFANVGKALAAYQRKLLPGPAAFDHYVADLQRSSSVTDSSAMSRAQLAGLKLFIGKAQCINCHNGPLFTNNDFHNTAVLSAPGVLPAAGRSEGLRLARSDPFNCTGKFSDADASECIELEFARGGDDMIGAQRTGSLRNLADTAPYMHAGQIATLEEVIDHYVAADIAVIGHNEAKPLNLRAIEKRQLRAFLDALNGALATEDRWLQPPAR